MFHIGPFACKVSRPERKRRAAALTVVQADDRTSIRMAAKKQTKSRHIVEVNPIDLLVGGLGMCST